MIAFAVSVYDEVGGKKTDGNINGVFAWFIFISEVDLRVEH